MTKLLKFKTVILTAVYFKICKGTILYKDEYLFDDL